MQSLDHLREMQIYLDNAHIVNGVIACDDVGIVAVLNDLEDWYKEGNQIGERLLKKAGN